MLNTIITFLKQSGIIVLILFLIFILMMYINQDHIIYVTEVNGLKYPSHNPIPYQNPSQLNLNYKEVIITTKDNIKLYGWLIYKEKKPNKTMIYFHENAGNIGLRIPFLHYIIENLNMNCLLIGYRGYGKSEGIPSELGLKIDGEAISKFAFEYNEISNNYIDKNNIYLFGRSLGGAVAIYIAVNCNFKFKGIIIENTFSSMGDLVDNLYPILIYFRKYLLKSNWDSKSIISKIKFPVLFCRSENDELIPKSQMDLLFNLCNNCKFKDYYVIKNGNHNEGYISDRIGYAKALNNFFKKCEENYSNDNEIKKDK